MSNCVTWRPSDIAWHNRIVTRLLWSSKGDLMLDQEGDLRTRIIWGEAGFPQELPFAEHRPGDRLATIHTHGGRLTGRGAEYILENCTFAPRDRARLERISRVGGRG